MLSRSEQHALIDGAQSSVEKTVSAFRARFPKFAGEDLEQIASVALAESAEAYDSARGAVFTTFAHYRVHGALLNHVRKLARPASTHAALARTEAAAHAVVEGALAEYQRTATYGPNDAAALVEGAAVALATVFTAGAALASTAVDHDEEIHGEDAFAVRDERRRVRDAMTSLPDKERVLLEAIYVEGLTIAESAARVGLSASWAKRLHWNALDKLRSRLKEVA